MAQERRKNFKEIVMLVLKSRWTKIIGTITFILLLTFVNSSFFIHQRITPESYFINCNDVDRLASGSTIVQISELQTAMIANQGKTEPWVSVSGLLEIDSQGNIIWEYMPDGLVHHVDHEIVERNGGYFFCDSFKDAVKFVRKSTKEVEWAYHLKDINWTLVNSTWGPNHLYNLPCEQWDLEECIDWSHLNDIDFKNYGTWESMLISIRNFNLIIEVNYTRASQRTIAVAEDIVWYYHGELTHQHNPDYLPNGNLLIVNSDKQKIIELNMTTKEVIWEWSHPSLSWPRDCDLMPNNRLLVTDVDKVLIVNITSGDIIHIFEPIFGGYEADFLPVTNTVLVSCGSAGVILEYDIESGKIVWRWGTDVLKHIVYSNMFILIFYEFLWIMIATQMKSKKRWFLIIPFGILIVLELSLIIGYYPFMVNIFVSSING